MPRIAIPEAPEVTAARERLKDFMASQGVRGTDFLPRTGVRQDTVSKFLTGVTKSITPNVAKILEYARIGVDGIDPLLADRQLRSALASAWDGTPEGTAFLAEAIQALAPIIRRLR